MQIHSLLETHLDFTSFLHTGGQIEVVRSSGREEGGIYAKYRQMLFNLTKFPFLNAFECEANK